jgi:hypothetical protein
MKSVKVFSCAFTVLLVSILLSNCTKDTSDTVSSTEQVLIKTPWSIDYYFDVQDMTGTYTHSILLFSSTGAIGYQKSGKTVFGRWSRIVDASNNELIDLQFNTTDTEVMQLNRTWKLTDHTASSLQFEETDGAKTILFRLKVQ